MTEYRKTQHTLPSVAVNVFTTIGDDTSTRNSYISALRAAGWTLQSISDVTGITRERVRQVAEASTDTEAMRRGFDVPKPPEKTVRKPKVYVEPDPAKLSRLLALQPDAQKNRHNTDDFLHAAEEYTALVWEVHSQDGVSLYRLAKALGVTHGALRFRLARYGYKEPQRGGVSKVYTRIDPSRRALV